MILQMKGRDNKRIARLVEDAVMEVPVGIEVGGEHMFLYPVTLGRAYLISRERAGMASGLKDMKESGKMCVDYRRSICRVVAIQTLREKEDIFDAGILANRVSFLFDNLSDDELFSLYDIVIESMGDSERFIKESGIVYDRRRLEKVMRKKSESGSVSFLARTVYGKTLDPACERYGWTLDYVVWGISLTNLEMMLADAGVSIYLSPKERKGLSISTDREIIDAGNPANRERIREILKG